MKKSDILIQEVAHQIYLYRDKNSIDSTQAQDWARAEYFLKNWKKEFIQGGDEFLELWLEKYYHKSEGK